MRYCLHCGMELSEEIIWKFHRKISVAAAFQAAVAERNMHRLILDGERVRKILRPSEGSKHYRVWVEGQEWAEPAHPNKRLIQLRREVNA